MTDNLQLQTSRLTDASDGNLIDDSLADIENCLRVIFGITADFPISQVMSITAAGDVTLLGDLTLAAAPTNNLHAATKKYVDDNVSVGGSVFCRVYAAGEAVPATSVAFIEWAGAYAEVGDDMWDVANPTRITIDTAGDYLIQAEISIDNDTNPTWDMLIDLYVNNASVIDNVIGVGEDDPSSGFYMQRTFMVMLTLAQNDYIELRVGNVNAEELDVIAGFVHGWSNNGTAISVIKVG